MFCETKKYVTRELLIIPKQKGFVILKKKQYIFIEDRFKF